MPPSPPPPARSEAPDSKTPFFKQAGLARFVLAKPKTEDQRASEKKED